MFLVIDNYDSFTFNLVQYLGELSSEHSITKDILVKRNDEITLDEIIEIKPDAIYYLLGQATQINQVFAYQF